MGFTIWILPKRSCMISTTVTSRESTQTRRCYLPTQITSRIKLKRVTCTNTFMLISICPIFSRTRKKNPIYDNENKKVIGKMEDELKGEIIGEIVGLRVKMYSVKTKKEMKKAKRVKKNILKNMH